MRVRTYCFSRCFARPPGTSTRNHPDGIDHVEACRPRGAVVLIVAVRGLISGGTPTIGAACGSGRPSALQAATLRRALPALVTPRGAATHRSLAGTSGSDRSSSGGSARADERTYAEGAPAEARNATKTTQVRATLEEPSPVACSANGMAPGSWWRGLTPRWPRSSRLVPASGFNLDRTAARRKIAVASNPQPP